jgi:hypothetical protein
MRCALRPLDSSLSWSHSWVTESPSYGTESLADIEQVRIEEKLYTLP